MAAVLLVVLCTLWASLVVCYRVDNAGAAAVQLPATLTFRLQPGFGPEHVASAVVHHDTEVIGVYVSVLCRLQRQILILRIWFDWLDWTAVVLIQAVLTLSHAKSEYPDYARS